LSPKDDQEFDAMLSSVRDITERIISLSPNMPIETGMMLRNIDNNNFLLHYVASNVNASIADKQKLLEESNIKIRTESLLRHLQADLQMAELKSEITNKARGEIDKQQREYFLQQQLKS